MLRTFGRFFIILFLSGILLLLLLIFISGRLLINNGFIPPQLIQDAQHTASRAIYVYEARGEGALLHYQQRTKERLEQNIYLIEDEKTIGLPIPDDLYFIENAAEHGGNFPKLNLDWNNNTISLAIALQGQEQTPYIALLHSTNSPLLRTLRRQLVTLFITALLFILLGSLLLTTYVVRPMRKLQKHVRQFGDQQQTGQTINADTPLLNRTDVIGDVARSFKTMAEKVDNTVSSQRLALHTLSHELRTPLTRLQLSSSIAEEQKDYSALVKQVNKEIHQMDELISRVLQLARLEAGTQELQKQNTNLTTIINQCIDDAHFAYPQKQILFTDSPKLSIKTDAALLRIALDNVLRNALRFATSKVVIQLEQHPTQVAQATISIEDDGKGITDKNIESNYSKLFDAFYQTQRASGHYGLGLAITQRITLLLSGDIQASRSELGGLKLTFTFPY